MKINLFKLGGFLIGMGIGKLLVIALLHQMDKKNAESFEPQA